MTRRNFALFLIASTLFFSASLAQAAEIDWGNSLETALRAAKKSGRPVLVDFYADWCGWCKRLDSDVYTDANVIKTSKQFINVKLDSDRNGREAARRYSVGSLPTVLVLNGDGDIEARFNGYAPAPVFNARLVQVAQTHRDLPGLLRRYRANPSDLDAAFRLTQIYARRGDEEQAQRGLARVAKLDPDDSHGKYAKSLNSMADMYASRNNFDEAIPLFKRALRTGRSTQDIGYSQLSLAVCHVFRRDLNAAQVELKAALTNPKISEKDKADARRMLGQLDTLAKQRG